MAHDDNSHRRARSTSRSRPTTPLRPSSRSSFRDSARNSVQGDGASFPLNTFEPAFAELSDAVADLEANMMHFQLMHESLARFSESFASFLYGLNMNAFCVDFPEDDGYLICREPPDICPANAEIPTTGFKSSVASSGAPNIHKRDGVYERSGQGWKRGYRGDAAERACETKRPWHSMKMPGGID
ncbi:hypothetical protein NEMBOFW57_003914 [Staphylotrichum longicolle]|uniref:DASH complex subunit DAM1 n=1 Tax=Staphylotrichum longicolle TaxID=669026 RepID=A0AAD4HZZ0_9PEZI|nr:hypothetical protein NEMBOFW57_003914 [Staphylotrichum longicolle]